MNTEKTPLVQKLILGVLALILVCLIVLIAQNRVKDTVNAPEAVTVEEAQAVTPQAETEPAPVVSRSAQAYSVAKVPVSKEPARPVVVHSTAAPDSPPGQPLPSFSQPPPVLVNPVRPQPVDIVLQPHAPTLQTEICGRVRLDGKPPPEIPIAMDSRCSRLHDGPVTTRHYVVGPEGGLANVFVYVKEGLPRNYSPPPALTPVVTAIGCFFEPYVLGMQAGQKLTLQNADNVLHNFHALAKTNREFNVSLSVSHSKQQRVFTRPEIFVRLKCDVHPWEFAYVAVLDHPFFAVTDTNGVFCLPAGLPRGRYVLAAIHLKAGETLREIIIGDEPSQPIELALNVPPGR